MTNTTVKGCRLVGVFGAILVAQPAITAAQGPRVGDVQHLPVITIAMQVGSMEKETRRVVYTPPPGWYVRSHTVHCSARTGNSSFSVSTLPRAWTWSSSESVGEQYRLLIDLAGKVENKGLQTRFTQERDHTLAELQKVRATHHALVVEATARGEGFLRSGGSVLLTVTAELVYIGTDQGLQRMVVGHRSALRLGGTSRGTK